MSLFSVTQLIGEFHPVVLHLPIGFILIAFLLEWYPKASKRTVNYIWMFAVISSLAAVLSGFLLSNSSYYPPDKIFLHKWLGVGIATSVSIVYLLKITRRKSPYHQKQRLVDIIFKVLTVILLIIGGHYGGQITHGDDFLIRAFPQPIQKLVGYTATNHSLAYDSLSADSMVYFSHLVKPILDAKCVACHNKKSQSGKLDLSSYKSIIQGGVNGPIINAGNPDKSELWKRLILPQNDKKFMPTKGLPLTYDEEQIVKKWLVEGGDETTLVSNTVLDQPLITSLKRLTKHDFTPKPWYEKIALNPLDTVFINNIAQQSYSIKHISQTSEWISIELEDKSVQLNIPDEISKHILELGSGSRSLSFEDMNEISDLPHLRTLILKESNISDDHVVALQNLPRLEVLNLYGTQVTDGIFDHLRIFPSLTKIYLGQTNITAGQLDALRQSWLSVEIIGG